MESFLAEYGLSAEEGIALMCLVEALPRVPDEIYIDALIRDTVGAADWGRHIGLARPTPGLPAVNRLARRAWQAG